MSFMKGPQPIASYTVPFFYKDTGGDTHRKEEQIDQTLQLDKYERNDGSLSCRLYTVIYSGDLKQVQNEDGSMIQKPGNEYEVLAPIDDKEMQQRLLKIVNEKSITNDFPINCSSKEEAIETLKKILED